jgi:hypothetical protein
MKTHLLGIIAVVGVVTLAAPAVAQPEAAPSAERDWSVTLSPVHLLIGPIVEVTVERRVGDMLGVAVMAGGGRFTDESDAGIENTFTVFEGGVSARVYALGDFEQGLQVGASGEYVHLAGDDVNNSGVSAVGNGLLLSPFIGYKHVWSPGITFDGQIGPSFLAVRAEAEDGSSAEDSEVGVNLNLNVGWSF